MSIVSLSNIAQNNINRLQDLRFLCSNIYITQISENITNGVDDKWQYTHVYSVCQPEGHTNSLDL